MALRPINGERRNADIRATTTADQIEKPTAQQELKDQVASLQLVIDAAVQALADMDVIIAGVDATNNAQLRTMVKDMARSLKDRIRDVRDLAQASKRTIRVVA
jgi:predicted NBD/HSP70 family sugar kinase